MLILFKAWREPSDLRGVESNWALSYESSLESVDMFHHGVMNNMQMLHECRDERDDHMQTWLQGRKNGGGKRIYETEKKETNELGDVDMEEVLEHLSEIKRLSSKGAEAMRSEAVDCVVELEKASQYNGRSRRDSGSVDSGRNILHLDRSEALEEEWKHTYERRKNEWKEETKNVAVTEGSASDVCVKSMDSLDVAEVELGVINDMENVERTVDGDGRGGSIDEVMQRWTLNREQERAFEIVARHATVDKPCQLLMYLGGPGGTGKSRVVNALRDFFSL